MTVHLTIGVSTSLLFDTRPLHKIYEEKSREAYEEAVLELIEKGSALPSGPMARTMDTWMQVVEQLGESYVDIVLASHNNGFTGMLALREMDQRGWPYSGAVFTNGRPSYPFLNGLGADVFYTPHIDDYAFYKEQGPQQGQTIVLPTRFDTYQSPKEERGLLLMLEECADKQRRQPDRRADQQLKRFEGNFRIHNVFDHDSTLVGSEGDKIFSELGPAGYFNHMAQNPHLIQSDGPLAQFAQRMGEINSQFDRDYAPVVNSVMTARGYTATYQALVNLKVRGLNPDGYVLCLGGGYVEQGDHVGKKVDKAPFIAIMKRLHPDHTFHMYDDNTKTYEGVGQVALSSKVTRPQSAPLAIGEADAKNPDDDHPGPVFL